MSWKWYFFNQFVPVFLPAKGAENKEQSLYIHYLPYTEVCGHTTLMSIYIAFLKDSYWPTNNFYFSSLYLFVLNLCKIKFVLLGMQFWQMHSLMQVLLSSRYGTVASTQSICLLTFLFAVPSATTYLFSVPTILTFLESCKWNYIVCSHLSLDSFI